MNASRYAEVMLPLAVEGTYTYSIPTDLLPDVNVGSRVIVPLGLKKFYTGIITEIHDRAPGSYKVKAIYSSSGCTPFVKKEQLDFWKWIASYYLCTLGEVMKAALPAGLKPESDAFGGFEVIEVRTKTFVRLASVYIEDPEKLHVALNEISKAKKQVEMLLLFIEMSGIFKDKGKPADIGKKDLLVKSGSTSEVLKSLCKKQILECYEKVVEDDIAFAGAIEVISNLNEIQEEALTSIRKNFETKPVCLLHGYTSSGKTEIYMHLIAESIASGKQALFLVPEIALTTQLSERLRRVFGDKAGVYHSGLTDNERIKVWNQVSSGNGYQVILGARSSIFLPFRSLGLVIIDEEHESSFKQQDPAPRYNARNAALVLASIFNAKTLLGTATPSIESYANCLMGKSGLTELFSRFRDMELPQILTVNIKELKRKKRMKSIFSPLLEEKIGDALEAGEQVILFQNRRGYAPVMQCRICGWVPKCDRCEVSLTYHKYHNKLCCHYCGFERSVPDVCPYCGEPNPSFGGFGTEQVEEEVRKIFPQARTVRMDTDTTRTRRSFENILHGFEAGNTDILIGTQMVSKGLDFSNVRVAGILNADQMLNFPDFRAHERAFQLMTQVSGRAGRSGQRGVVIIQTSQPESSVTEHVVANDYKAFFNEETSIRKAFGYPPYTRIVNITLKHHDASTVRKAALMYAGLAKSFYGERLLGPDQPQVSRINNFYLQSLLLKIDINASASGSKELLCKLRDKVKQETEFRSVQIIFDVDPV